MLNRQKNLAAAKKKLEQYKKAKSGASGALSGSTSRAAQSPFLGPQGAFDLTSNPQLLQSQSGMTQKARESCFRLKHENEDRFGLGHRWPQRP